MLLNGRKIDAKHRISDIESANRSGHAIPFFDPRRDIWDEHFKTATDK